jgi:hypothetical protein
MNEETELWGAYKEQQGPKQYALGDFVKLEERVFAQMVDAGTLASHPGPLQHRGTTTGRAPESDEAFVERMTRAFPHLGESND